MKKQLLSLLVMITLSFSTKAQDHNKHHEKIKTLKIAYLTEQLNLTTSEAEKFWPVYNVHNTETRNLYREKSETIKNELKAAKTIDSIEEGRALVLFDLMQSIEKRKFEETQKYYKKLKNILPIKKILKLQIAEREFSRKLMRKYRQKKGKDKK